MLVNAALKSMQITLHGLKTLTSVDFSSVTRGLSQGGRKLQRKFAAFFCRH